MSTTTKERPILFSGPMIRALLDGRKTQTRRVVKPQPLLVGQTYTWPCDGRNSKAAWASAIKDPQSMLRFCPYGAVGERLWVRETFAIGYESIDGKLQLFDENGDELDETVFYRATDPYLTWTDSEGCRTDKVPWKSPIHMPRAASRITLEITDVRVQRLQEISDEDAIAEGAKAFPTGYVFEGTGYDRAKLCHTHPSTAFAMLWDEINGPGSWESDPWVWALTFRVVKGGAA